jgi:methionyl aminopeptidase
VFGRSRIELKTPEQVACMRAAGVVVHDALARVQQAARPGSTTAQLDAVAEQVIRAAGAVPNFLGYGDPPFPASTCISVNDEVVHGIPGSRVLAAGDVVSVDCGAAVDGWHADAAVTFTLGPVAPAVAELLAATEAALWQGIAQVRAGGRVGDVSAAVQRSLEAATESGRRYGIVRDYTGHGIGSALHQPPDVPNVGRAGSGPRIVEGTVLAVEPMVVLGDPDTVTAEDEWTVVSADGSLAAHFEHTVAVTATGSWVLTAADGGRERLAALGVPFGGP